ncbi:MAG: dephospho-CoA kinase [Bacteroidota bacterium]|nr:dephospho-CoA kinase [Bacteroidota bacterium]
MLQVGVTGGIGSGKSTIAKVFQHLGASVYDSDSRSKWLQENDEGIIELTKALFGQDSYDSSGKLNRNKIAREVFSNPSLLQKYNGVVHPAVFKDYQKWVQNQADALYIIKESALLIETGSYKTLDSLILVTANNDIKLKRIKNRDPFRTESEIKKIIASQMPDSEKLKFANYIVNNDESDLILPTIIEMHHTFVSKNKP